MTPRQEELLGILQEECAELIVAVSKIRRFGEDSTFNGEYLDTNKDQLIKEMLDVAIVMEKLFDYVESHDEFGDCTAEEYYERKVAKLEKFMKNKLETE